MKRRQEYKHLEKKSCISIHQENGTSAIQKAYIVPKDKEETKYN